MASRASGSGTPASSNITRPGLTTATQPSGTAAPTRTTGAATSRPAASSTAVAPTAPVATRALGSLGGGLIHARQVRAGVALRHDLALVDPALDADPAKRGCGLVESVIDVGPERVQRHASVGVTLGPRHLGAAQAA